MRLLGCKARKLKSRQTTHPDRIWFELVSSVAWDRFTTSKQHTHYLLHGCDPFRSTAFRIYDDSAHNHRLQADATNVASRYKHNEELHPFYGFFRVIVINEGKQ